MEGLFFFLVVVVMVVGGLVAKWCPTPLTLMDCSMLGTMGFSRQEYWSGLPFPSPGDLPDPGMEPGLQCDIFVDIREADDDHFDKSNNYHFAVPIMGHSAHIMSFNSHNPDGWELLAPFYRGGN